MRNPTIESRELLEQLHSLVKRLTVEKLDEFTGSDLIRLRDALRETNRHVGVIAEAFDARCLDLVDALHEHDAELLIPNEQDIITVEQRGYTVRFWDEGFGPTWVYRDSTGIRGVVRAVSFEAAWACVIDEIMDDADPEDSEIWDGEHLAEGYHWRSSGIPSNEGLNSTVAQEDPNGSTLQRLTRDLANELEIDIYTKTS